MGIASGPLFDRAVGQEAPGSGAQVRPPRPNWRALSLTAQPGPLGSENNPTPGHAAWSSGGRRRESAGRPAMEPPDPTKSSEPRLGVDRACRTASGHETAGLLNEPRRTRRGEATTPSVLSETYKISGTNDVQIVRFLLFLLLVSNRRCAREPIARGDGRGASGPNRPAQAKGRKAC